MTTTALLPTVKIPPIVSIKSRPLNMSYHEGVFHDEPTYRIFAPFAHFGPNGELKGVLLLGGNWGSVYTCCGAIRVSALRADYVRYSSWHGDANTYMQHNRSGAIPMERKWQYILSNRDTYPTVNKYADNPDVSGWSEAQVSLWGRAVLATYVKSLMIVYNKSTCMAIDRKDGHTYRTLAQMGMLRAVNYGFAPIVNIWNTNGATRITTETGYCFMSRFVDYDIREELMDVVAYAPLSVRNLNSGNTLYPLTCMPRRTAKTGLISPTAAPEYRYVPCSERTWEDLRSTWYDTRHFARIVPEDLAHA
jgi:hypothetical protein